MRSKEEEKIKEEEKKEEKVKTKYKEDGGKYIIISE